MLGPLIADCEGSNIPKWTDERSLFILEVNDQEIILWDRIEDIEGTLYKYVREETSDPVLTGN